MSLEYKEFVTSRFASKKDLDLDLLHCTLGLLSETLEYQNELNKMEDMCLTEVPSIDEFNKQQETVEKEIGDMLYYNTMLQNLLDTCIPEDDIPIRSNTHEELTIGRVLEEMADIVKKKFYYGHKVDLVKLYNLSYAYEFHLESLALNEGTTIEVIKQQNQDKLTKRYSSGTFTPEEAARKADKE